MKCIFVGRLFDSIRTPMDSISAFIKPSYFLVNSLLRFGPHTLTNVRWLLVHDLELTYTKRCPDGCCADKAD